MTFHVPQLLPSSAGLQTACALSAHGAETLSSFVSLGGRAAPAAFGRDAKTVILICGHSPSSCDFPELQQPAGLAALFCFRSPEGVPSAGRRSGLAAREKEVRRNGTGKLSVSILDYGVSKVSQGGVLLAKAVRRCVQYTSSLLLRHSSRI